MNHWIPFAESEVDARDCFASHFMSDFLKGKGCCGHAGRMTLPGLDDNPVNPVNPVEISPAARAVLDAGRELWRYYHKQPKANPNASYYDIRRHFQGMKVTAKGKEQMNPTSDDARYNELLAALRGGGDENACREDRAEGLRLRIPEAMTHWASSSSFSRSPSI